MTYILFMVMLAGGTRAPAALSHEFSSQAACETAKENIRQKANGTFALLTCEKKS